VETRPIGRGYLSYVSYMGLRGSTGEAWACSARPFFLWSDFSRRP